MHKNYWWIAPYNYIQVEVEENSVQHTILRDAYSQLKPVGNGTYLIKLHKNFPKPEDFFASINKKIRKYSISPKDMFREKLTVERTFDDLKNISVSVLPSVIDFKPPKKARGKKKKDGVAALKSIGVKSIFDVLFTLPRKYIDQTDPKTDFSDVEEKELIVIMGTVVKSQSYQGSFPRTSLLVEVAPRVVIEAVFFRQPWIAKQYRKGARVVVNGKFGYYRGNPQVTAVSIENDDENTRPVIPVYKQSISQGVTTKFLEHVIEDAFRIAGTISTPDFIDDIIPRNVVSIVRNVHFPGTMDTMKTAREHMAIYEMSLMQSVVQNNKKSGRKSETVVSSANPSRPLLHDVITRHVPFTLTDDQSKAVDEMTDMMDKGHAETVLLSADVGAGKTIIAQLAAVRAVEAGNQAVLAAPTEVLARQLYDKTAELLRDVPGVEVAFLSGNTKATERKELEKRIKSGEIDIVVGTHVVLTHYEMYNSLGFVCIDEQHKFGAEQRTAVSEALSSFDGRSPVVMQQTATPIPRSMAHGMFGGIHMIRLQQKPSGRKPIKTKWVNQSPSAVSKDKNNIVWRTLDKQIKAGNQAFVIAPFVTDSAFMEDVSSVETLHKQLSTKVFPKRNVAMIHGKMKAQDIEETMQKVRAKEYDIVVASTVVEVGVDIPDATFIVIMSADRLGVASLHQLRGRVGRNSKQSYCVLVSGSESEQSQERMQALEKTNDGFELAEFDLQIRGSGKLFGSKQAGDSEIRFAHDFLTPEIMQTSYERACGVVYSSKPNAQEEVDKVVRSAEQYFDTSFSGADMNGILL